MQQFLQDLNSILQVVDDNIGGSIGFVLLLLGTGVFFTLYLGFPQIRYFGHAIRVVRGKYDKESDQGDTSHFQALATALSGTVGTGNIAGVAFAIHLGGAAALFWMMMTAFLGMTTKFVEVTMSHKYREVTEDGTMAGGPMYYMKNRLNWKIVATIFAIATVVSSFGTGSLPQINSIANSMFATFGFTHYITGAVLSVALGLIIIGGIQRIAQVSEKLVPFMAIIYFIGSLSVIVYNYQNIIPSFISIFADLFTGSAATGGFLGATIAFAFNRGVNRGLFSNEAGQGSAPIAHAAARAHEPVSEGIVALLEPFIDTIVICMLTGLTILASGAWSEKFENQFQQTDLQVVVGKFDDKIDADRQKLSAHFLKDEKIQAYTGGLKVEAGQALGEISLLHARSLAENTLIFQNEQPFSGILEVKEGKLTNLPEGIAVKGKSLLHSAQLTTEAFKRGIFGDWGKYIVSIGLLLFAFSTAVSWSYYGDRAMTYLLGAKSVVPYRIVYVIGFFLASFTDTTIIWTFSGIAIACMTIPNLVGILFLHKEVKSTIKEYWTQFRQEYPNEK